MKKYNVFSLTFALVLSLFYGIIAAGQILSFLNLYTFWGVIILSTVLVAVMFVFYRQDIPKLEVTFTEKISEPAGIAIAFIGAGLLIYVLLVFYPLAHWPFSPISQTLTWDAGLYHFPKAAEMLATGSAWDLSIAYGEYPFGYETLIAFALLLNKSRLLIGMVHALISLFLLLATLLLFFQRTRLPRSPLLLLLALLFFGYQLNRSIPGLWAFWPQLTLIGKNDVLLAAALLAVIVHIPSSKTGSFSPLGLAMSSMIAISVKPNAILLVGFAWGVMIFFMWRADKNKRYFGKQLILSLIVVFPGILWVIRNLFAQHAVLSQKSMKIAEWSIANNLMNPYFYRYIPMFFWVVIGVVLLSILISVFWREKRFDTVVAIVLLVSFAVTPATAFFGSNEKPAEIAWRFGLALLIYVILLILVFLEPVIRPAYLWVTKRRYVSIFFVFVLAFGSIWCVWTQRDLLRTHPDNAIVLYDQYKSPVGMEYYSAYDYVQKNVHDSVVIVENGLPFYLYDRDFTNSVTRSRPADYIVYLQTSWINQGGYPPTLEQAEWLASWELVYEDSEGRVYKRRSSALASH